MRNRMRDAAEADTKARANGQPAMHKLKMLPQVISLLNRNTLAHQIVDPDINLLESVKFFLEPLNDGSLPAYNIQRELFAALARLPITKDTLVASGIGKVVLFYTRSTKVEPNIKSQAEKLVTDWMRPILKRTDDFRKREVETARYDGPYVFSSSSLLFNALICQIEDLLLYQLARLPLQISSRQRGRKPWKFPFWVIALVWTLVLRTILLHLEVMLLKDTERGHMGKLVMHSFDD
jgi:TFIIS helical bundle-like domain